MPTLCTQGIKRGNAGMVGRTVVKHACNFCSPSMSIISRGSAVCAQSAYVAHGSVGGAQEAQACMLRLACHAQQAHRLQPRIRLERAAGMRWQSQQGKCGGEARGQTCECQHSSTGCGMARAARADANNGGQPNTPCAYERSGQI